MEVISGVHQIKIPFPQGLPQFTNIYVVEGEQGNIMIDCGWDSHEAFSALYDELKKDRLAFKDVKEIVITHIHADHYGLAGKIREFCGAKVAMHRIEAELINSRYVDMDELLQELGELLSSNGVPQAELSELKDASLWMKQFATPEPPEILLNDGDRISNGSFKFEVLLTPGHSPGHICLYEAGRKILFSGDHVLFDITPHIGLHPQSGDNPLGDYINSLRRLEDLKVNFVFPGHGPVFNSLGLRAAEIIRHHEQRKTAIIKPVSEGLKTVYQIATEIPWVGEQNAVAFKDLKSWDRRLAILETAAHLRLLLREGKVGKIDENGLSLYLAKD